MMKKIFKYLIVCICTFYIFLNGTFNACAQAPAGTTILNQDNVLGNFKDKQWYKDNIPFLEVPDQQIQEVYYYRWYSYYAHLNYVNPANGYVVTEFSSKVSWSQPYGGISCAAGHHLNEGRWLKDQRYMTDLADYWSIGPGAAKSRDFSFWKADSYYARYMVNGDQAWIKKMYPRLIDHYNGWGNKYNAAFGMYWQEGIWDGMEQSASSFQSPEPLWGVAGYRPTINAYMYADALAISKIAAMMGNTADAASYTSKAQQLKTNLHDKVWDPNANFFKHKYRDEIPGNGAYPNNKYYAKESFVDAREQMGYVPWYVNMPIDDPKYIKAWEILFDGSNGFYSNYGPTTLEKSHRLYRYADQNCCHWDGMSWPFSTAQTLTGIANVLNNYNNKGILNKDRYFDLFKKYTLTQYKNGRPYIAEAHDPETNVWTYDGAGHSEHYNHSTYNDLIITGLLGLRPRADNTLEVNPQIPDSWQYFILENIPYHGHLITILLDKAGNRYGQGNGFKIYQDGSLLYSQANVGKVTVTMAVPNLTHNYGLSQKENYATNQDETGFPTPSASFTSVYDNVWEAVDGKLYFDALPKSRWTSYGSNNPTDWFAVDYGTPKNINRIDILFYDDNGGVKTPASYQVQYWNGSAWMDIQQQQRNPANPVNDRNTVRFPDITTQKVRVVMIPQNGADLAITEFETWKEITSNQIGNGTGLSANYYAGMNFNARKLMRTDETVDFDWAFGSPDASVPIDQYSVRWTGEIQPIYSEMYTFHINSDNGRRVWINDVLIIDKWISDWNIDYTGQIYLEAGRKYKIKIEYFEEVGGANIVLKWESARQFLQVVPKSQLYPKPDTDADGVPDADDGCPADIAKIAAGNCGCGKTEQSCLDCAGVANGTAQVDVCNVCTGGTTGKTTLDTDRDGTGDCVDTDDDNDGVLDADDCAPLNATIKGKTIWYADTDGDGFGDPLVSQFTCTKPTGYVADKTDVCPTDPNKKVAGNCGCGKTEQSCLDCAGVANGTAQVDVCGVCTGGTTGKTTLDTDRDGIGDCVDTDNDNDGVLDVNDCAPLDATIKGKKIWYADTDGDGFGDPAVSQMACTKPAGYVADKTDVCPTDPNKKITGNCGCGNTEQSCVDCAGVANGTAVLDNCQVCVGGTTGKQACTRDCHGDWGGTAVLDVCNECAGGNTGITVKTNISQCATTATSASNSVHVTAIPQPFELFTTIEINNAEILSITIVDATGNIVYQKTGLHEMKIEVGESLANGIYTVLIQTESGVSVIKILKLK